MMPPNENPYAAPVETESLVTEGVEVSLTIATSGKRLLNMIIDTIGFVVLAVVIELLLLFNSREISDVGGYILTAVVQFVYYYAWEITLGKTPGKFLTGTCVISLSGERPTSAQIVKRSLARLIPFESFSFLRGDGHPIGLHDSLSSTCVVNDR